MYSNSLSIYLREIQVNIISCYSYGVVTILDFYHIDT